MTTPRLARTLEEMRFAAQIEPCVSCGTWEDAFLRLEHDRETWTVDRECAHCGARRAFVFTTTSNPLTTRAGPFDLGAGVSACITVPQLLAALDAVATRLPSEGGSLDVSTRKKAMRDVTRALTCVSELLKVAPFPDTPEAQAAGPRMQRAALEREYVRLRNLYRSCRPPTTLGPARLAAHMQWLARGGSGPGYLELHDESFEDQWLAPLNLTFASLTAVDLTNVEAGLSILDEATLTDCVLRGAMLDQSSVTNARITGGAWSRVRMSRARLDAAQISGADFSLADLDRSSWRNAQVRDVKLVGAVFHNAVLDGAAFERCSFRAARFDRFMREPDPTSRGARFIDCDFRGVSFADRDLTDTTFVRCVLSGVKPPPSERAAGLVITDCDVDVAGFLAGRPA